MTSMFETVKAIIDRKRLENIRPLHALDREIKGVYTGEDMAAELDKMVAVKILSKGRTINHDYYKINGQDDE